MRGMNNVFLLLDVILLFLFIAISQTSIFVAECMCKRRKGGCLCYKNSKMCFSSLKNVQSRTLHFSV